MLKGSNVFTVFSMSILVKSQASPPLPTPPVPALTAAAAAASGCGTPQHPSQEPKVSQELRAEASPLRSPPSSLYTRR